MQKSLKLEIEQYLAKDICVELGKGDIPMCPIPMLTKGMQANSYFFGHEKWGKEYFENSHRSESFKARWRAAIRNWDNKIVVDKRPGDGITPELYYQVLVPLGFKVKLYPHNHDLGSEVLEGKYGKSPWRLRLSQRLSGINPNEPSAAQSIMCIAKRTG